MHAKPQYVDDIAIAIKPLIVDDGLERAVAIYPYV